MINSIRHFMKKCIMEHWPFVIAFLLMCAYLLPQETMADVSGDAGDIWRTITSYGTNDVYGSYVLYKGFNAIYPYVWLYKFAVTLGINEWFFVKLYYCMCFAYVTAVGFPNMTTLLTKQNVKAYRKMILVILCFYYWEYTYALDQFMVDLPCLFYFVLMVNSALRIYRGNEKRFSYIWLGLMIGINLCASGQYTMPAICVIIFMLVVQLKRLFKNRKIVKELLKSGTLLIIAFAVKMLNHMYLQVFVGGLKEKGAWIPSSSEWLAVGFSRFSSLYRVGAGISIPSSRNVAIFQSWLGEGYEELIEGYAMTPMEYIELVFQYFGDFALCYLNKFFLALSPDQGGFHFIPLFIFYTLLFIALCVGFDKCKTIKSVFNVKFWIGFAFLWSIVPGLVMVIEPRYCMQLQGIVLAMAICSDFIWEKIKEVYFVVKSCVNKEKSIEIGEAKVSYCIVIYIVFIVMCFMMIGNLYEQIGVEAESILMGL